MHNIADASMKSDSLRRVWTVTWTQVTSLQGKVEYNFSAIL